MKLTRTISPYESHTCIGMYQWFVVMLVSLFNRNNTIDSMPCMCVRIFMWAYFMLYCCSPSCSFVIMHKYTRYSDWFSSHFIPFNRPISFFLSYFLKNAHTQRISFFRHRPFMFQFITRFHIVNIRPTTKIYHVDLRQFFFLHPIKLSCSI